MKSGRILTTAAVVVAALYVLTPGVEAAPGERALMLVKAASEPDLEELISSEIAIYTQLNSIHGPLVLVGAAPSKAGDLVAGPLRGVTLDRRIGDQTYYVVYRMPVPAAASLADYGAVLYDDGIRAVMEMDPKNAERLAQAGAELRAVTTDSKPIEALRPGAETPYDVVPSGALNPNPLVRQMIDAVDSATVYQYTGDLSGEWPVAVGDSVYTIATRHTYSGTPIRKATQLAGERLDALGLAVEYHNWSDPDYPNVIGELPGSVSPDSIVIICGHLDDMPSGSVAPGADDNASGSVAVLVAADILSQYNWRYTLRFALWTGEEQGLLGSHQYALRSYGLGEQIMGVLNLDMIAYNTAGSARDIDLHANESLPGTLVLAQLFDDVVAAYGLNLIPQIVPAGIGASDHASFTDYGYSAILGIEDLSDFNPRLHTTGDQLQHLDMSYYVEFVKASVATVAHMAGPQSQADPVPATRGTAIAVLALVLAALGLCGRRPRARS